MRYIFLFCFFCLFSFFVQAQTVDEQFETWMVERQIPGLAVGFVSDGELLYEGYFGMANFELDIPVSESTSFMLASVSKHVTHFATLMALDQGIIASLDDPINDYLPFAVEHPTDETNITIRHLIDHTSGIKDNWDEMPYLSSDEETRPLGEYLENYLVANGDIYDANLNFVAAGIGDQVYSNIGFALLGFIVEAASDTDFAVFVREQIFEPLCMEHSSFLMEDLDLDLLAVPYNPSGSGFSPIGHYSYSDYPAGRLRASLGDMANYAITCLNLGTMDGRTLLSPPISYQIFNGHGGGDQGVSTGLSLDKNNGKATILMMNRNGDLSGMADWMRTNEDAYISEGPDSLLCDLISFANDVFNQEETFLINNPVSTTLSLQKNDITDVWIRDFDGKLVSSGHNKSGLTQIDVSALAEGLYLITAKFEHGTKSTQKFYKR